MFQNPLYNLKCLAPLSQFLKLRKVQSRPTLEDSIIVTSIWSWLLNPSDNSQKAHFQQEKVQKPMVGIALVVIFFIFPFSEKNKHTRACTVDYVYCKGVQQNNQPIYTVLLKKHTVFALKFYLFWFIRNFMTNWESLDTVF